MDKLNDMMNVLAQEIDPVKQQQLIFWLSVVLGVVIVGFTAIMLFRGFLRKTGEQTPADAGFSLSELRAMRDRGEITPEEYEHTRARVVAKVRGSLEKKTPKPPPPEPPESLT